MNTDWILDFNDYSRKKTLETYTKNTKQTDLPDTEDYIIWLGDLRPEMIQQLKIRSVEEQYFVIHSVVKKIMLHSKPKGGDIENSMLYMIIILKE